MKMQRYFTTCNILKLIVTPRCYKFCDKELKYGQVVHNARMLHACCICTCFMVYVLYTCCMVTRCKYVVYMLYIYKTCCTDIVYIF